MAFLLPSRTAFSIIPESPPWGGQEWPSCFQQEQLFGLVKNVCLLVGSRVDCGLVRNGLLAAIQDYKQLFCFVINVPFSRVKNGLWSGQKWPPCCNQELSHFDEACLILDQIILTQSQGFWPIWCGLCGLHCFKLAS